MNEYGKDIVIQEPSGDNDMMRAMILAAGEGKRMRPLTLHTPKALLKVAGTPLIIHHLMNFANAGIREIVINLGHLGSEIEKTIGDGSQYKVNVAYSHEDPILETGGGIHKALDLLGAKPFIVVSSDLFTDYPFSELPISPRGLAHLVLTDNPPYHPKGDYALIGNEVFEPQTKPHAPLLNFGGIGVYRPELFHECPKGAFRLPLLFKKAFQHHKITGEYYQGIWYNIGTAEDLNTVNNIMQYDAE